MNIRPATLADVSALLTLQQQADTAAHWSESQYKRIFIGSATQRLALIAEIPVVDIVPQPIIPAHSAGMGSTSEERGGNAPVLAGFLVAMCEGPEWEIENVVVAPNWRRRRVAARLLCETIARARRQHADSIFLEVRASNLAARALYERGGFKVNGHRSGYYSEPEEDAIVYRLSVGAE